MLITDRVTIGNNLYALRKRAGLTQAELAEAAGLADRTYADIERGSVNMRLETILRICSALHITPDEVLTAPPSTPTARLDELLARLETRTAAEQNTALTLLETYLNSLN